MPREVPIRLGLPTVVCVGDYGRGGVEAIRRLLNNDACIGADLTMVNAPLICCSSKRRTSVFLFCSLSVRTALSQLN